MASKDHYDICKQLASLFLSVCLLGVLGCPKLLSQEALPPTADNHQVSSSILHYDVSVARMSSSHDETMRTAWLDDGFSADNTPLDALVSIAYNIRGDLIASHIASLMSQRFTVKARVAPQDVAQFKALSQIQQNVMLQEVLQAHFGLQVSQHSQMMTGYELTATTPARAVTGLVKVREQFKGADENQSAPKSSFSSSPGRFVGNRIPLETFVSQLEYTLSATIVDRTQLIGLYDINLHWSKAALSGSGDDGLSSDLDEPDIFTALSEEAGLRLHKNKIAVRALTVEAAHLPTND